MHKISYVTVMAFSVPQSCVTKRIPLPECCNKSAARYVLTWLLLYLATSFTILDIMNENICNIE